tara:strand:+ start:4087 stop:5655 length:1569 start_codon:yes stop_codon:yes gene_type:complete
MAKPLQAATIVAPGFFGLNTQESGVTLEAGFALQADNCIIDKYGRLGSRKGWAYRTSQLDGVTDDNLAVNLLGTHISTDLAGTKRNLSWNATSFFRGYNNLVTLTPTTTDTITTGSWMAASLNDRTYFFQSGYKPLVYTNETTTDEFKTIDTFTGYSGTVPSADIVISAYGRLWAASTGSNKTVVSFSDLLDGTKWGSGSAGTLNIAGSFAKDSDIITGLGAHNGFFIIFCQNSIMIYKDSDDFVGSFDVATLSLVETIEGIGCISHETIQNTGEDILFLSATGVRSLGRTIQEKSQPLRDLSRNIRSDLALLIANEADDTNIKAVYCPLFAFYLLYFPNSDIAYCFDTRAPLEDGAFRVTKWLQFVHNNFVFDKKERKLLFCQANGLAEYFGSQDNAQPFNFKYYTNYFDLGSSNSVKIAKKLGVTVIAPANQVFVKKIGFDYSTNYFSYPTVIEGEGTPYHYGEDEYTVAEFTGGLSIRTLTSSVGGSGSVLQAGFEAEINGAPLSIQRLDVYVKAGRIQ